MSVRGRNTCLWDADPFRRPDHRWQLAGRIARGEIRCPRGLDDGLQEAVAFRRREQGDACSGRRRRGPHDDAIGAALKLHDGDGPVAWEARARILARQSDVEIAERCGLTPEAVAWYAKLFFDVRARLDAFSYIISRVIGRGPWQGFQHHELGAFWAWMAWVGGPLVLDLLVNTINAVCRPGEQPTLGVYLRRDSGVPLDVQALVAIAVLPHIGPAATALMPLQLGLIESQLNCDPARAERRRDRVRRAVVQLARAHLAGRAMSYINRTKPSRVSVPPADRLRVAPCC